MGAYRKPLKKVKQPKRALPTPSGRLTAKQITYADYRSQGLKPREAGLAAGYTDNSANWYRLERSKDIKDYLRQLAGAAGITPERIMTRLSEGLDAETQREFCGKEGLVLGQVRPDFGTRLQYINTINNIVGITGDKGQEGGNVTVNILSVAETYRTMDPKELASQMQRIKLKLVDVTPPKE